MLNLPDQTLFRQIIMEHYARPSFKGLVNQNSIIIHQESDSCIDNLQLEIITKKNVIVSVRFDGIGCAISCSASDIIAQEITNKTLIQAKSIINNYLNMLLSKPYDKELLNELIAFSNVPQQPNRIRCATLGANGFLNAIAKTENNK